MLIKSVLDSDEKCLAGIIILHNNYKGFDLDPCYSVGNFYKETAIPQPRLKFDLTPQVEGVTQADVCALPCANGSIGSIVFDPPFMFGHHGQTKNNAMNKRFTMFNKWDDLERTYKGALKEFHRILARGGIVAFKCQDYTDSKTTLTHCFVHQWASELGFYAKDLFILSWQGGRIYNSQLKQKHARKFHSYWFVFQK